jgi:hypothetical protein
MNFPETSTREVFNNIPVGSVEAMPDFMWSDALWHLGNCKIDLKQKIGKGFIDVKLRYYNDLGLQKVKVYENIQSIQQRRRNDEKTSA